MEKFNGSGLICNRLVQSMLVIQMLLGQLSYATKGNFLPFAEH